MAQSTIGESRTLEDRIRAIEDRLEIYNLIASHPPSADTGADYYTRASMSTTANSTSAATRPRPEKTRSPRSRERRRTRPRSQAGSPIWRRCRTLPWTATARWSPRICKSARRTRPPSPRGAQSWRVQGLSNSSRRGEPLGTRTHRRRMEDMRRTVRTIDGSEPPREILRGALRSFEPSR